MRDYLGRTLGTVQGMNQYELALGSHARSGEQFDIWQAVYGPVGDDGYPKQIFNKETGEIDRSVAAYWKEHYDLSAILQRDWATLGPKLQGKLHIYVGSADTYFLNDAVYYLEDFLKSTKNPPYDGEVKYGDRAEHCWNGDPESSQLSFASALQHHVLAQDSRAHAKDRAAGSRPEVLALLSSLRPLRLIICLQSQAGLPQRSQRKPTRHHAPLSCRLTCTSLPY